MGAVNDAPTTSPTEIDNTITMPLKGYDFFVGAGGVLSQDKTKNDSFAGIATSANITLKGVNATITLDQTTTQKNIYGIYIGGTAAVQLNGTDAGTTPEFRKIIINNLPANAYVFKNASTAKTTFTDVGLAYGGDGTGVFGIHNGAEGKYDFAADGTEFSNMTGATPDNAGAGGSATGLSVAAKMTVSGNLIFNDIVGGSANVAGKGGDAIGLELKGATLDLGTTGKITFKGTNGIKGGGALGTGVQNAGDAIGISGNGIIQGGTIELQKFTSGTAQGAGTANIYAINGNVTLKDAFIDVAGTTTVSKTYAGIYHNIDNAKYAGTITVESSDSTTTSQEVVGLEAAKALTFTNAVTLKVLSGKGAGSGNSGDATGLILSSDTNNTITGLETGKTVAETGSLTLDVASGNGMNCAESKCGGSSGNAIAISIADTGAKYDKLKGKTITVSSVEAGEVSKITDIIQQMEQTKNDKILCFATKKYFLKLKKYQMLEKYFLTIKKYENTSIAAGRALQST